MTTENCSFCGAAPIQKFLMLVHFSCGYLVDKSHRQIFSRTEQCYEAELTQLRIALDHEKELNAALGDQMLDFEGKYRLKEMQLEEAIVRSLKAGESFDLGPVGKIVVKDGVPILRPRKDLLREMGEAPK